MLAGGVGPFAGQGGGRVRTARPAWPPADGAALRETVPQSPLWCKTDPAEPRPFFLASGVLPCGRVKNN